MNPSLAIRHLEDLADLTRGDSDLRYNADALLAWKTKVRTVLVRSLGEDNNVVREFDGIWFSPGIYYEGQPEMEFVRARIDGMATARGCIEAAVFELGLSSGESEVVVGASFDTALWSHVEQLVAAEDWTHVPAAVAIFVEDRVRTWAALPNSLVGRGLYAKALGDDGVLRLGIQAAEWEGWRALGMGLAQAVGNVARHRIDVRQDTRAYALGVLGLGSLLLTQIRWEHAAVVQAAEA